MIEIGDIVRLGETFAQGKQLCGKLGIVVVKGTWSRDVRLLDTGREYRLLLEELELITK